MIWHPAHSLSARIVVALLLAFVLTGAALTLNSYWQFKQQMANNSALLQVGRALAASLHAAGTDEQARVIVASADTLFNELRSHEPDLPGPLLLSLHNRQGQLLFASPTLRNQVLDGRHDVVAQARLSGGAFWVYTNDSGPWRLHFAEPRLSDATVLGWLLSGLLPELMLAFPFVLLPVWLAVRQGLAPLRKLSHYLEQRRVDDLAPIAINLRYRELKPVITSFNGLLARLRQRIEGERAFVQDAAHELRTPMAVVAAQAHVLARADNPADRHTAQSALQGAIERASHLTSQLLDLAALDHVGAGSASGADDRFDLAGRLQQMLADAAPLAMARRIELSLDAPDSLACGLNAAAFHSIVQNLLDNALRYVPEGGQIQVSLTRQDGNLLVTVADDGPGIPLAERDQVFERFRRGQHTEVRGTGLGLAIVRKAAESLGGTVRLHSGLHGRGCCFEVQLPTAQPLRGTAG